MGPEACSEDEAYVVGDRLHYRKLRLAWQSKAPDVIDWKRTLDNLHMSTRHKSNGDRKPGRLPRHRYPASGTRTSDPTVYPKGLPINFYDQTWLTTLDEFERRQLHAKKAVELIFPDNICRHAIFFG